MLDISEWLAPIDAETPSGKSLREEADFHALERKLTVDIAADEKDKAAAYARGLDAIDWAEALDEARGLADTGRDVRLLVMVVRALAATRSYAGLAQGLDLLSQTLDAFWDSAHPVLREGRPPREAALRRINAMMELENDDAGLLADLKARAVLNPRGIGPITGRDLAQAGLPLNTVQRELPSGLGEAEKSALLAAHDTLVNRVTAGCRAEADQNAEVMSALASGLDAAIAALSSLQDTVTAKLGDDGPPVRFPELGKHLDRAKAMVVSVAADAAAAEQDVSEVTNVTESQAAPDVASPAQAPASGGGVPGRLNTRKDVERCLDLIIDFYERTEPSSPLPHLARRMRRMVPMDFLELIEEVAPGGLKDFQVAVGSRDKK